MTVKRVMPDLETPDTAASQRFYTDVLGLSHGDGHGLDRHPRRSDRRRCQVSLFTHEATGPVVPVMSVEVDDVDAAYEAALAAGARSCTR